MIPSFRLFGVKEFRTDSIKGVEPLLSASISTSREHLNVVEFARITNGTLAVYIKCEELDILRTALQDKPKSPSRCLSRYRLTNSNSTFDGLASIKLLVKPDKNEAK